MKINGMECPHCGSTNTYKWKIVKATILDDSAYEAIEKEFGESRLLYTSTDNVIYRCKCNDCAKYFVTMAALEVKAKKNNFKRNVRRGHAPESRRSIGKILNDKEKRQWKRLLRTTK